MKVAKLVLVSLMTRVVVDENATEDEIIKASRPKFHIVIDESLGDNVEEIMDDEECPVTEEEKNPEKESVKKFRNYYRCPDCNTEWQDEWFNTCDDECPTCSISYWPYKSEDIN